jgi:uncharacterized membrane protein
MTKSALALCLAISVALNFFALGALVAGKWMGTPQPAVAESGLGAYPRALRDDVRQRLFADRDVVRAAFADLDVARQNVFAEMRAEPLDATKLADAMADVRSKTLRVQALLQGALLHSLKVAPAAERSKIEPPSLGFGLSRFREDGP